MEFTTLPRWDLSTLYPALESPEFTAAYSSVAAQLNDLVTLFDRYEIAARPDSPLSEGDIEAYEAVTNALNAFYTNSRVIRGYLGLRISIDSRDAAAQARASELRRDFVTLSLLSTRYTAWLGSLDTEALIAQSTVAAEHAFGLRRARISAQHLMSPEEESLSAELGLSGSAAWARLHGDLTSQLTVELDGETQPMSVVRSLATDPDREIRKRAYEAELAGWKRVSLPLAAAMNGIKHETRVLSQRRGWSEPLEMCCFTNYIDRATLDAMLSAAKKTYPDFRRYLKAKARLVSGDDQLPWYDLFAPVGSESRTWEWPVAEAFIETHFDGYSSKLGDFARLAFRERWIDAEPRPGKRDGAFCLGIGKGTSRIMQNYRPSFDGVSTLAHELGHGYHNLCLAERTILQSNTPMTLAETASIFCETIIKNAALAGATSVSERLAILEGSLQNSCQLILDIPSRFLFESWVIEKRAERELSEEELCGLMVQAQTETYGDGLAACALHPYMWAVKGHYYGSTYYNFPYMFGLLFGLGLYAIYEKATDRAEFHARYDALLSRTGMADAATLAAEFGLNIQEEAFWSASLDVVRSEIAQFEALVDGVLASPETSTSVKVGS